MTATRQHYKLPDGRVTASLRRYLREWHMLSRPIEKALALHTIGFDPGLTMRNSGREIVEMPLWFAQRLAEALEK